MKRLIYMFILVLSVLSCEKEGGKNVTVSVTPQEMTAPFTTSTQKFDIVTNGAWTLEVLSPDGLQVTWAKPDYQSGTGNTTVKVRVYKNEYRNDRTAILTVTSESGETLTCTLTQAGDPDSDKMSDALLVRVGTFNLAGSWRALKDQWAWDSRKTRLRSVIQDCDFDVFGVNEFGLACQEYFAQEIGDKYNIQIFSPYAQNGVGDRAIAIIYKKNFTLKEFHYFWLADDPETIHMYENGYSYSPACVGILADNQTGIEFCMIVTHGPSDESTNLKYYGLYEEWNKKFNPEDKTAFLVGDMNFRSGSPEFGYEPDPEYPLYSKYWTDSYITAQTVKGPFCTYNDFNMSRNLNTHPSRIDYIWYRHATPVLYVNHDTLYDGYYASDHQPIYTDMIIRPTK